MKPKSNKLLLIGGLSLAAIALYKAHKPASTTPVAGLDALGALAPTRPNSVIAAQVQRIASQLGHSVNMASQLTGTPTWLIIAITANEIGDFPFNTVNPAVKAAGVMQQTFGALVDTIYFAQKDGLWTPALQQFFVGKLGPANYARMMAAAKKRTPDKSLSMTEYLRNPDFCLVCGALMLRVLLNRCTDAAGQVNFGKVALGYNRGYTFLYNKLLKFVGATLDKLYTIAPSAESRAYLKNVTGVGGYLDIARSMNL